MVKHDWKKLLTADPTDWLLEDTHPGIRYLALRNIMKMAEALTALGYGPDPRLANTLQMIRDKQQPDGKWLMEYVDTTRKLV